MMGMPLFGSVEWLSVLGFIAIVALAIMGYIKFLGKNADRSSKGARFFHFDHFYIEKILKAIYLFSVVSITVIAVITPLSAAITASAFSYYLGFGDVVGAFFAGLFAGVLIFLVGQFLSRICFEYSLMFVRLVTDTRAIRTAVAGDPVGASQPPMPSQTVPPMGGAQVPTAPYPVASAWTCAQCGRAGNTGSFCGSCGAPRP